MSFLKTFQDKFNQSNNLGSGLFLRDEQVILLFTFSIAIIFDTFIIMPAMHKIVYISSLHYDLVYNADCFAC